MPKYLVEAEGEVGRNGEWRMAGRRSFVDGQHSRRKGEEFDASSSLSVR